jgi:hypothetical protein
VGGGWLDPCSTQNCRCRNHLTFLKGIAATVGLQWDFRDGHVAYRSPGLLVSVPGRIWSAWTYPAAVRLAEQIHRLSTESTNRRESRDGHHLKLTGENSDRPVMSAHALSCDRCRGPVCLVLSGYILAYSLHPEDGCRILFPEVHWTVERYCIPENLTKV